MASKQELWAVQIAEYPNSVRISIADVYKMAMLHGPQDQALVMRCIVSAMAQDEGAGIFYYIPNGCLGKEYGYRYGLEGSQYYSGFSRMRM